MLDGEPMQNLKRPRPQREAYSERSRRGFARLFLLTAVALTLFGTMSAWAIPSQVTVTGYLTEPRDVFGTPATPITGDFPMRLTFFEDVGTTAPLEPLLTTATVSTTPTATVFTTATVRDGVLNALVQIPDAILVLEEIWYFVAIDLDRDGFNPNDQFGDPIRLTSVPYALSAQPLVYFESHGGHADRYQTSVNVPGRIAIAPFSAPPGGVTFNRMAASFEFDQAADTSFGVYDSEGNLLFHSPKLNGQPPNSVLAFEVSGKLAPSRIYYTAVITSGDRTPAIGTTLLPTIPTRGFYLSESRDGSLPEKIDLAQIQFAYDYRPVSISFYNVDETAPPALRATLGRGVSRAAKTR